MRAAARSPRTHPNVRCRATLTLVKFEEKKGPTASRRRPITPSSSQMRSGGETASHSPPRQGHGGVGRGLGVGLWRHIGVGSFERSMIQSDYARSDSGFMRQALIFDCADSAVVALFDGAIPALVGSLRHTVVEKTLFCDHGDRHDGNGAWAGPKPKYYPELLLDNFHAGGRVTTSR